MAGFFGMFDYTKPGKGVSKEDIEKSGIELFADILIRRFWKLIMLNILFVIASIPAILISWFISTYAVTALVSFLQFEITTENVTAFSLLSSIIAAVLIRLAGTGPASAGMSYVIRKYVNDTHSWVWSDFWENIKNNFVQALAAYIINLLVMIVATVSIIMYPKIVPGIMGVFLRTVLIVIMAVFLMMQMYVYQIMSGFKLRLLDIYKNAAILVIAKLPWNILVAAVSAAAIYGLCALAMNMPIVALAVAIFGFYSLTDFIQIFMTNNVVKKYLLEPAQKAEDEIVGG